MNFTVSDGRLRGSREPCGSLLVGMTGSVGAVAMPQFVLHLRLLGIEAVHILMSAAACKFVTPYVMQLHSGNHVYTDSFETHDRVSVPHIALPRKSKLFLVMPATANILGKAANGICDDLISTAILAATSPVMFVPSMNGAMWGNPILQENVQKLRRTGHRVLEPSEGIEISNLEPTRGCMPPLNSVADEIMQLLSARSESSVRIELDE